MNAMSDLGRSTFECDVCGEASHEVIACLRPTCNKCFAARATDNAEWDGYRANLGLAAVYIEKENQE